MLKLIKPKKYLNRSIGSRFAEKIISGRAILDEVYAESSELVYLYASNGESSGLEDILRLLAAAVDGLSKTGVGSPPSFELHLLSNVRVMLERGITQSFWGNTYDEVCRIYNMIVQSANNGENIDYTEISDRLSAVSRKLSSSGKNSVTTRRYADFSIRNIFMKQNSMFENLDITTNSIGGNMLKLLTRNGSYSLFTKENNSYISILLDKSRRMRRLSGVRNELFSLYNSLSNDERSLLYEFIKKEKLFARELSFYSRHSSEFAHYTELEYIFSNSSKKSMLEFLDAIANYSAKNEQTKQNVNVAAQNTENGMELFEYLEIFLKNYPEALTALSNSTIRENGNISFNDLKIILGGIREDSFRMAVASNPREVKRIYRLLAQEAIENGDYLPQEGSTIENKLLQHLRAYSKNFWHDIFDMGEYSSVYDNLYIEGINKIFDAVEKHIVTKKKFEVIFDRIEKFLVSSGTKFTEADKITLAVLTQGDALSFITGEITNELTDISENTLANILGKLEANINSFRSEVLALIENDFSQNIDIGDIHNAYEVFSAAFDISADNSAKYVRNIADMSIYRYLNDFCETSTVINSFSNNPSPEQIISKLTETENYTQDSSQSISRRLIREYAAYKSGKEAFSRERYILELSKAVYEHEFSKISEADSTLKRLYSNFLTTAEKVLTSADQGAVNELYNSILSKNGDISDSLTLYNLSTYIAENRNEAYHELSEHFAADNMVLLSKIFSVSRDNGGNVYSENIRAYLSNMSEEAFRSAAVSNSQETIKAFCTMTEHALENSKQLLYKYGLSRTLGTQGFTKKANEFKQLVLKEIANSSADISIDSTVFQNAAEYAEWIIGKPDNFTKLYTSELSENEKIFAASLIDNRVMKILLTPTNVQFDDDITNKIYNTLKDSISSYRSELVSLASTEFSELISSFAENETSKQTAQESFLGAYNTFVELFGYFINTSADSMRSFSDMSIYRHLLDLLDVSIASTAILDGMTPEKLLAQLIDAQKNAGSDRAIESLNKFDISSRQTSTHIKTDIKALDYWAAEGLAETIISRAADTLSGADNDFYSLAENLEMICYNTAYEGSVEEIHSAQLESIMAAFEQYFSSAKEQTGFFKAYSDYFGNEVFNISELITGYIKSISPYDTDILSRLVPGFCDSFSEFEGIRTEYNTFLTNNEHFLKKHIIRKNGRPQVEYTDFSETTDKVSLDYDIRSSYMHLNEYAINKIVIGNIIDLIDNISGEVSFFASESELRKEYSEDEFETFKSFFQNITEPPGEYSTSKLEFFKSISEDRTLSEEIDKLKSELLQNLSKLETKNISDRYKYETKLQTVLSRHLTSGDFIQGILNAFIGAARTNTSQMSDIKEKFAESSVIRHHIKTTAENITNELLRFSRQTESFLFDTKTRKFITSMNEIYENSGFSEIYSNIVGKLLPKSQTSGEINAAKTLTYLNSHREIEQISEREASADFSKVLFDDRTGKPHRLIHHQEQPDKSIVKDSLHYESIISSNGEQVRNLHSTQLEHHSASFEKSYGDTIFYSFWPPNSNTVRDILHYASIINSHSEQDRRFHRTQLEHHNTGPKKPSADTTFYSPHTNSYYEEPTSATSPEGVLYKIETLIDNIGGKEQNEYFYQTEEKNSRITYRITHAGNILAHALQNTRLYNKTGDIALAGNGTAIMQNISGRYDILAYHAKYDSDSSTEESGNSPLSYTSSLFAENNNGVNLNYALRPSDTSPNTSENTETLGKLMTQLDDYGKELMKLRKAQESFAADFIKKSDTAAIERKIKEGIAHDIYMVGKRNGFH